ncbi:Pixie, isoform A [Dirofilaria immitis]|nr:Pixie, isoform A [Dirofilaria immitis]
MNRLRKQQEETDKMTRIAIVEKDRCKPKIVVLHAKNHVPLFEWESSVLLWKAILEWRKYPKLYVLAAVSVNLAKDTTHRFSKNSFKLHRLPTPRTGEVLGLVGTNGIGKSTALKILAGKLKPNLGKFETPPDWPSILAYFRGSELQNYFTKILEDNLKAVAKPQYVDQIPKYMIFLSFLCLAMMMSSSERTELNGVKDRMLDQLSGGELQRFAIAMCVVQHADVYMFDEPSSYLDVKQRLKAAKIIRDLVTPHNYVIVVEHDLAVLDYLSDFVCCLYGMPGVYGVVTLPSGVREGINIFLDGFIPTENMRFRDSELSFKVTDQAEKEVVKRTARYTYPSFTKRIGNFELKVEGGEFTDSEIIVMLGENGTGKTTMIRILAGNLQVDDNSTEIPRLNISYKPQRLVQHLSGGELQRVALALCLGKVADVYLIDEPSAYLDSEQRLHAAKVIKRFILHAKKTAFVVEHDFLMGTYLADRVIVFEGIPSKSASAQSPQSLLEGMNRFLRLLDITFRRDKDNYRPRINKKDSVKDMEQKKSGNYFFLDVD